MRNVKDPVREDFAVAVHGATLLESRCPWGSPNSVDTKAPGIKWYDCPGHGGFKLSPDRLASMPPEWANFQPFAGPGWFEEDLDFAVVVLSFPDAFDSQWIDAAKDAVRARPDYYQGRGYTGVVESRNPKRHNLHEGSYEDEEHYRAMLSLGVKWPKSKSIPTYPDSMSQYDKDEADRHYDSMSQEFLDSFGDPYAYESTGKKRCVLEDYDDTEDARRALIGVLADTPHDELAGEQTWDTDALQQEFEVLSFLAPFVLVRRRSDGVRGTVMFKSNPRVYFGFQAEGRKTRGGSLSERRKTSHSSVTWESKRQGGTIRENWLVTVGLGKVAETIASYFSGSRFWEETSSERWNMQGEEWCVVLPFDEGSVSLSLMLLEPASAENTLSVFELGTPRGRALGTWAWDTENGNNARQVAQAVVNRINEIGYQGLLESKRLKESSGKCVYCVCPQTGVRTEHSFAGDYNVEVCDYHASHSGELRCPECGTRPPTADEVYRESKKLSKTLNEDTYTARNTLTGETREFKYSVRAGEKVMSDGVDKCTGPCKCRIEPDGVCGRGWPSRTMAAGWI